MSRLPRAVTSLVVLAVLLGGPVVMTLCAGLCTRPETAVAAQQAAPPCHTPSEGGDVIGALSETRCIDHDAAAVAAVLPMTGHRDTIAVTSVGPHDPFAFQAHPISTGEGPRRARHLPPPQPAPSVRILRI